MKQRILTALANWKTTSAGLTSIAGGVLKIVYGLKTGDMNEQVWMSALGLIFIGVGLVAAGDATAKPALPPSEGDGTSKP